MAGFENWCPGHLCNNFQNFPHHTNDVELTVALERVANKRIYSVVPSICVIIDRWNASTFIMERLQRATVFIGSGGCAEVE